MTRLLIHVEGETEETFVNEALAPHLYGFGYTNVGARLLGNARRRNRRGGIRGWDSARRDILNHLRQDPECRATTMVDYYALPQTGTKAWPGRFEAASAPFPDKASTVEGGLARDITSAMGEGFAPRRFVPFVMMHEFEGLLFSDCHAFSSGIQRRDLRDKLQAIRDQFSSPEEINDSPTTSPSKRIEQLLPNYNKPFLGTLAILEIGFDVIRRECPHFNRWIQQLESAIGK